MIDMADQRITVAKNAGFCFGVARATKAVESEMAARVSGERIFTLGRLIHNADYNRNDGCGDLSKRKGYLSLCLCGENVPHN